MVPAGSPLRISPILLAARSLTVMPVLMIGLLGPILLAEGPTDS
jgi:hypothetical protein